MIIDWFIIDGWGKEVLIEQCSIKDLRKIWGSTEQL